MANYEPTECNTPLEPEKVVEPYPVEYDGIQQVSPNNCEQVIEFYTSRVVEPYETPTTIPDPDPEPEPEPEPEPGDLSVYVPGIWGLSGAGPTLPAGLADNPGIVGVVVTDDWSNIEETEGDYDFSFLDTFVASAKAAGYEHINIGITNSTNDPPEWLRDQIIIDGDYINLRDPGQNHSTFCDEIATPLYWGDRFHNARLALIEAAGAHFTDDPAIHGVHCSFMNHNSLDWNIQDTRGELSGPGCGGTFIVDQAAQWRAAGFTRAIMLQVGKEIITATAEAWPNQRLRLPIGGLDDALANESFPATVTGGSPTVTSASANFTSADLHSKVTAQTPLGATAISNNTYIGVVNSPTSIELSSSAAQHIPKNATASGTYINIHKRTPDPRDPNSAYYSTLAYEITAWANEQEFADRFYIQRNTVDTTFGTRQALYDNPPGYGAERYIKRMIADETPNSGLQDVSKATGTANDSPPYRQNGNQACTGGLTTEECEVLVITNSMAVFIDYEVAYGEIWVQDAQNPLMYDAVAAATLAMGGTLRTLP